jgi:hypothetical protein
MQFTFVLRRPARRTAALLVALSMVAIPGVALANHQFNDVDTSHPFHADISAIAGAGITAGFNDGGYHPSDPVTRQAMAAFMHRGFGRAGISVSTVVSTATILPEAFALGTNFVPVRQLSIEVPGANNVFTPQQLVHVQGRVTFNTEMGDAAGCPCEFEARVLEVESTLLSAGQVQTFYSPADTVFGYSLDVEGIFVAPPGERTYELQVRLAKRAIGTELSSFNLDNRSSLSAMTFPFPT